ncbi:hypothetical protein WJX84_004570 [Apatococcus fuscideae]|uniref:ABC transporter domain-containing protein n=1 Tax=Apatococcus fuscideae TaxID=2026836 RepID=A0AAW1SSS3_9CHLO
MLQQFWAGRDPWEFVPVDRFAQAFQLSSTGVASASALATPYDASRSHPNALAHKKHALSGIKAFKACFRREWILTKRHLSVYKLRTAQVAFVAVVAATVYLRTHIHDHTLQDGTLLSGFLFYTILVMMFNGITELALTIERLPVFYRHYKNQFYPAWAFVLPATILRIPFSLMEAVLWSVLTYFEVGLTADPGRFFAYLCLLFLMHQFSVSFFRLIGAICRNVVVAFGTGSLALITILMLGGFAISYNTIHWGWRWFCWANPVFYAQRAIIVNEFSAPRWQSQLVDLPGFSAGTSLGDGIMESRGFATHRWWTWLGMGALGAAILICQLGIILAHAFLGPLGNGPVRMSDQALEERELACHGVVSTRHSPSAIKPSMLHADLQTPSTPVKPISAADGMNDSAFEPSQTAAAINGSQGAAPHADGFVIRSDIPIETGAADQWGLPVSNAHGLQNGYAHPASQTGHRVHDHTLHGGYEHPYGRDSPPMQQTGHPASSQGLPHGQEFPVSLEGHSKEHGLPVSQGGGVLVGGLHPDQHLMSSITISALMATAPDMEKERDQTVTSQLQTSMMGSQIELLKTKPAYHPAEAKPEPAASGAVGMVLPFTPAVMTFKDINYYADPPPMIVKKIKSGKLKPPNVVEHGKKVQMQLLAGVSGAFRPGILTCLFGVSGAGKTTLLDVLACRKTGGRWDGDVRVDGHPQQKETFARISGYAQQFDIHSPQATVREALLFSARCRLSKEHNNATVLKFVEEIERLVELDVIKDAVVGLTGISGLSTEQRKRLTIAVELVANPAIVFMDEPTTGLDARAAAVVMRTIRNVVNTGRTMVATIHQPSIDIFESFDELLLLMRGGRTIYWGPLGRQATKLFEHFELNPKVPKHTPGINPATWVLTTTSLGMMKKLGTNYAIAYAKSSLNRQNMELIENLSQPKEGSAPVHFASRHSLSTWGQYRTCFHKFLQTNWHNPNYNGTRYAITITVALVFGTVFWKDGQNTSSAANLFNSVGAVYVTVLNLGVINSISVQPGLVAERFVFYREHRAGYYSALPWYLANASVQFIFILAQAILYVCIVYFMAGFKKDVEAFFWFLLFMLLTLLYFTFYGSLCVFVTANVRHANILGSTFYTIFNLFAGFAIAPPSIPGWWIWFYWINPNAHTVYGLISTQFLQSDASVDVYGERVTLTAYIQNRFGFHHNLIGYNVLVLCGWTAIFLFAGALALRKLNFMKL